ncbi:MAG: HlyD family efflux transporter periplasmic adaptor subunit [Oscillospiraceae bacterium]|nr:HlyD family efflux transporter periplasmic adaptor subunit [Oscillospiraceae bacterium]
MEQRKKSPRRRKKTAKRIVGIVIAAIVIAAIVFGLVKLFAKEKLTQTIMTDWTYRGSIVKMIEGSGVTSPAQSETIPVTQKGMVEAVYCQVGDYVEAGQLLYEVEPTEAQKAVDAAKKSLDAAQKSLDEANKQLSELYSEQAKLNICSPGSGKLINCEVKEGDSVFKGQVIATLIDDSKVKLTQYFSYVYAGEIKAGMNAAITIPATMSVLDAKVDSVTMIERITPEGGKLFEAVIVANNPGTLAEGMPASACVISASGERLYPYENGELEYIEATPVKAEASGTAAKVDMKNYLRVWSGQLLVRLDADDYSDQLKRLHENVAAAQAVVDERTKEVEEAMLLFDGYSATAPISGTVMSCNLYAGEEVATGAAITIADTSRMYLEARIDGQDVANVTPGTYVSVTLYSGTELYYSGTVLSVSMEGQSDYGVAYFPATIEIDNYDGNIKSGMYCAYSIMGSQSDDCVLAPTEAVKYTEYGPCLFVRGEGFEGAVELEEGIVPAGFSAVPIVTGLSDDSVVEIREGVPEDTEVFTAYITESANSWENSGVLFG